MPATDFVIDQVSWHTDAKGNPESREHIERRFRALIRFLATHQLLATEVSLPSQGSLLPESFALRKSDLTAEGFSVVQAGYDKWLQSVDRGASPENLAQLEKALERIRSKVPGR